MAEIERLIKKGVITPDYLKEEVKDDFLITADRKKIWAIILDLMIELDRVCKKHNIKYYLYGGTLLGAIRHKGFIPWDDDVDVVMLRDDYEKFLDLKDEFENPYFFQVPETDPSYFYSFAKIRNSNTTGLNQMFKYQGFNHGIWLSIFPLDNWIDEGGEELAAQIKALSAENSTYMRMTNPNLSERDQERVKNYSGKNPLDTYYEIHRLAQTHKGKNTTKLAHLTVLISPLPMHIYERADFDEQLYAEFEGYRFPIPSGYDRQLTIQYGDYMKLPPVEDRGKHHSGILFDPDKPYTDYLPNI